MQDNLKEKFNETFKDIPKRKLKAYLIVDKYYSNESQEIVFAETAGLAKAKGLASGNFDDYSFTELRAERQKCFDKYSEKQLIPIKELLERGWWFYCAGCGSVQINEDDIEDGNAFIGSYEDEYHDFVKGTVICDACASKNPELLEVENAR